MSRKKRKNKEALKKGYFDVTTSEEYLKEIEKFKKKQEIKIVSNKEEVKKNIENNFNSYNLSF